MYRKLLVPVDGSAPSMLGLKEAIKLARSQGSELQLVHVVNELIVTGAQTPPVYMDKVVDSLRAEGKAILDDAARVVRDSWPGSAAPDCASSRSSARIMLDVPESLAPPASARNCRCRENHITTMFASRPSAICSTMTMRK